MSYQTKAAYQVNLVREIAVKKFHFQQHKISEIDSKFMALSLLYVAQCGPQRSPLNTLGGLSPAQTVKSR